MNQAIDSLMYFVVLGLLCGVVSFRLGWRIGGRIALPAIQAQLGFIAFAASWRAGGPIAAAFAAIAWAAGTTVVSVGAFAKDPERTLEIVYGAANHRHTMFRWLRKGEGSRDGVGGAVSRSVRLMALFLIAATLSGGVLAMGLGALFLNSANAYVAALMNASRKPDVTRFLAWSPWHVARVVALAALGSACTAPLAYRLGFIEDPSVIRLLFIVGGVALLADVILEVTLSRAYRERLVATLDLDRVSDSGASGIAAATRPTPSNEGDSMRGTSACVLLTLVCGMGSAGADTLLIANKSDHTVDLREPGAATSRATLQTGQAPHEIAVSPDGRTAAISNYGPRGEPGSSLTVIDVVRSEVLRTIELGEHQRPHGMVWYKNKRLAVTTEGSQHLLVVNPRNGKVLKAVETGQDISHMVAVTLDGQRAFVANIGSGTVTAIDLKRGTKLADIVTGDGAEGIALTPDGKEIWVGNRGADTLSIIDPKTLEVIAEIPCAGVPIRVAVTPDGQRVLVSCARTGEIALFDAVTRQELARATLDLSTVPDAATRLFGDRFGDSPVPVGLVISADGESAWVAATQSDVVVVIDTRTLAVRNLIRAGHEPDGLALAR